MVIGVMVLIIRYRETVYNEQLIIRWFDLLYPQKLRFTDTIRINNDKRLDY